MIPLTEITLVEGADEDTILVTLEASDETATEPDLPEPQNHFSDWDSIRARKTLMKLRGQG